ncbi:hypothetical protein ACWGB8_02050 [Kitasatospora sp. NPDC054939]
MSTTTTRLGLYKPADDGSELVNVQTDLNQNYDKLDLAIGARIVTSSTRPSSPYGGQLIQESDTSRIYVSNGSVPASGSWKQIAAAGGSFLSALTLGSTLAVSGAVSLNSTLAVTGGTTLSSTLGVTGATTLSSTLGVTGATTLSSTLAVTGATTLSNNLTVSGTGSATSLGGTLAVTGNITGAANLGMGAWTTYVPTWSCLGGGAQPSLGNGTLTSRWIRIGRTIHWAGELLIGSTTTTGSNLWFMSLPVSQANDFTRLGSMNLVASGNNYIGLASANPSDGDKCAFVVKTTSSSASAGNIGPTDPLTIASGHRMLWTLTYQAAS